MTNVIINYTLTVQNDHSVKADADGIRLSGTLDSNSLGLAKGYVKLALNGGIVERELAQEFGKLLYNVLFGERIGGHFREQAWRKVCDHSTQQTGIRLTLIFQEQVTPEITSLPWEFLYGHDTFFSTDPRITFSYRYDDDDGLINPPPPYPDSELPLRVLFVHTHPKNLGGIAAIPVKNQIQEKLEKVQATFDELKDPSLKDIQEKLETYRPHVFHFLGHGQFKEQTNFFALLDNDGNALWTENHAFSDLFPGWFPRLMVLQSCEGGQMSALQPFAGGAARLVRKGVSAVVAMRYEFEQKYGWEFNRAFYGALENRDAIDVAVQKGRRALAVYESEQVHGNRNFGAPVLWMNLKDGLLFQKHVEISVLHDSEIQSRRELLALAEKVPLTGEELKKLYTDCLPSDHSPLGGFISLEKIMEDIWDIPLQEANKRLPIFEFIERLACYCDTVQEDLASKLRTTVNTVALLYNISQSDIDRMKTEIAQEITEIQNAALYLLVEVVPDRENINKDKEGLYKVYISFWKHKNDADYILQEEEPHHLDDIKQFIEQALKTIAQKFPEKIPDLTIEFFLPLELMSCEVDQWCKQHKMLKGVTLGMNYKVVVRSLERAGDSQLKGYWVKRWQQYRQIMAEKITEQGIKRIYDEGKYHALELYKELMTLEHLCLGLFSFTPTGSFVDGGMLAAIVSAGIPIALWPRRCQEICRDPMVIQNKIETIVLNDNICNLPKRIKLERLQANDQIDIGNYLTLLWDDPSRLPGNLEKDEATRLQAPVKVPETERGSV